LFFVVEVSSQNHSGVLPKIEQAIEKISDRRARYDVPESFGSVRGSAGDMDNNPDVTTRPFAKPSRVINIISTVIFGMPTAVRSCCRRRQSHQHLAGTAGAHRTYSVLLSNMHTISPFAPGFMPYRVFLGQIGERLRAPMITAEHYENAAELLHDAQLIAASLKQNNGHHAVWFQVRRLIRAFAAWFHLVTLDLRQHADVHRNVIAYGWAIRVANSQFRRPSAVPLSLKMKAQALPR